MIENGMPRGTQTPDLQDRNLLLYSAELWTHNEKLLYILKNENYIKNIIFIDNYNILYSYLLRN